MLQARKSDVNGKEAKAKVQTTAKYILFDAWARTGTKRCNTKRGQGKMAVLQKSLLEFYKKLQQHFSTTILYCCLNIAIM